MQRRQKNFQFLSRLERHRYNVGVAAEQESQVLVRSRTVLPNHRRVGLSSYAQRVRSGLTPERGFGRLDEARINGQRRLDIGVLP